VNTHTENDQKHFISRFRRSISPGPIIPRTDKERKSAVINFFALHIHPPTVPETVLRFTHTFGLGGMALVLILIQFGTGILLKFAFEPTPMTAYASIQSLQTKTPFGQLIRNLHHWSASLLVMIIFLHMLRVYFTGAFHSPRQFNWIIGWAIFACVLAANFTGYLLPYDQLAYWAVMVSTGMLGYIPVIGPTLQSFFLGGADVGPATMRIFFAFHTALLPVIVLILAGFHFWRVRKAGGVVVPRASLAEISDNNQVRVPVLPNLLMRETVTALVLIAGILAFSVFFNATLGDPANPGLSPNPTKAPWYFAGFQELLLHIHPAFSVFVIPLAITLFLMLAPYINFDDNSEGVWFVSPKGRRMAIISGVLSVLLTLVLILIDDYAATGIKILNSIPPEISQGALPTFILMIGMGLFYRLMKSRFSATNNEAVQSVFVFIMTALIVLTIVGAVFRGKDMALSLPW